jgi:PAS domain S-box-containing protein
MERPETISELRRRLQLAEDRFRLIAETTHEAIYDWDIGQNRLEWTAGMQTVFAYTAEQVEPGIEWRTNAIHPDDRDRVLQGLDDAIANQADTWADHYRFKRGDGTYADVFDRGSFVYGGDGQVRMIGTMLDVSMEKRAREAHARVSQQLENLVKSVPGMVWEAWGPPDSPQQQNDYISEFGLRMLGYTLDEWISTPNFWITIVHPDDRERALQESTAIFARGSGSFRFRWLTKSGGERWFEAFCVTVYDRNGAPIGMRGVTLDIDERVRFEQERERLLARAQDAVSVRDEFLAVASHELRTPLTSLQLQMQALERYRKNGRLHQIAPDSLEKIFSLGEQQLQRVNTLISELLDVSRLTSGRLVIERERMNLGDLVTQVRARFTPDLKQSGSELALDIDPTVAGDWDRKRLDQVVTNLISNAIKYGNGKPITVRVAQRGETALLQVSDRGIGIAPGDQERIFLRWERAVSSRSYGGLGLGLFITRRLVDLHAGHIRVESEPEQGATFTVELPRTAAAALNADGSLSAAEL